MLTGFLKGRDADDDPLHPTTHSPRGGGPGLTFQLVQNDSGGKVVIDPRTGAFSYTPKKRADDHESFTFRVSDGTHWSNAAEITVTIARP